MNTKRFAASADSETDENIWETVEVALYPKIEQDADGNTLTGEKSYLLHFESYPQVLEGGFWSVTAPAITEIAPSNVN